MIEKVTPYRAIPMAIIMVVIFATSLSLGFYEKMQIGEYIMLLILDMIFLGLFFYELEYKRIHKELYNYTQCSFINVSLGVCFTSIVVVICVFLPEFLKPMILIPVVMCAFSTDILAIIFGAYSAILITLLTNISKEELIASVLVILFAAIIVNSFSNENEYIWSCLTMFFLNCIINILFYFKRNSIVSKEYFICIIAQSVFICLFTLVFYKKVYHNTISEEKNKYDEILDENYHEILSIKAFSPKEYNHAIRVSDLSYRCAKKLGYDTTLCAAAGFYYRMCKWDEEQGINKAIEKAKYQCFPEAVIKIISEYNGEINLPSSKESALINMTDTLVSKIEQLKSTQNNVADINIFIYQTLNEFSISNKLDASGMSMHQFLLVRDYLVKEGLKK
ncbi:hypothetical protein [Lachnobacterium bovis]|uniref:HD domain-containing protein n=1 Tax=Lachnobacterium bovis TaxID=140626 RepID=A0A1H9PZU0_9FIRM|nr:hypothetical protein [Lachnobacterium bovis]SER53741.1 hypothetical protein SAMN02910429_00392 [Lachnobacterium bovis]